MSIDRRIVSILYYNNIFDIEDVEKFIGENDNYYEVSIDGEVKKLKIPGIEYPNDIYEELLEDLSEVSQRTFEGGLLEAEKYAKTHHLFTIIEEEISFEEEMEKSDNENNLFLDKIKEEEFSEIDDEKISNVEIEPKKVEVKKPELKKVEVKKPELKKPETKKVEVKKVEAKKSETKKVEHKKIVTKKDVDDFMDTI